MRYRNRSRLRPALALGLSISLSVGLAITLPIALALRRSFLLRAVRVVRIIALANLDVLLVRCDSY